MEEKEKQKKKEEQEMVQWNDIKDNNNGKATTAIIILLLVIVIALGGFVFMKKDVLFNTKADNKEVEKNTTKEVEKEEKVTFSESELEKYVNHINPVSIGPSAKIFNVSSISVDSMSARDKIEYIGSELYAKNTSTSDFAYNILTEDDVKNLVEEVYGPNSYERTTFNLGCGDYIFRENEGKYYSKTGCGGTTATFDSNMVIDYTATKSKLEITTAYAFFDGMTRKIYKDFDKKEAIADYEGGETNETYKYLSQYVKDNKDNLNHIVYTFESEDGEHYYFKGFKNNK